MSTRTAQRRLRISTALIAATLAAPSVATAATDLRGENARGPGAVSQVAPAVTIAATDLRGEFAQVPAQLAATAPVADARGEFAKREYRTGVHVVAPAHSGDPSAAPSTLPFIVAGLVALLGFAAIAAAAPLRRRTRVSH